LDTVDRITTATGYEVPSHPAVGEEHIGAEAWSFIRQKTAVVNWEQQRLCHKGEISKGVSSG
jgi:hypothetical protein